MTSAATADLAPYDAVVVLSFGGPEAPEEVIPFLRHVTAGRGIPETRLADVAEHYFARGGISPINAHNRALVEALGGELTARGIPVPIRLANRHSAPWLADTVRDLYAAGEHDE
ncbi:MAG TPA: ferrochelatase, partial [Phycicoccus sp.]|nr:ferrochelatase [Phycicoccus sp.]